MKKIVCLGLIVTDILVEPVPVARLTGHDTLPVEHIKISSGGDANNQAIALAKLGKPSVILGKIGADSFGTEAKRSLEAYHVDIRNLVVDPTVETSTSVVLIDQDANRILLHRAAGNNDFQVTDFPLSVLDNAAILSIGSLRALPGLTGKAVLSLLQYAKSRNILTVADVTAPSFPQGPETVLELLPWLDYFLPSEAEAEELTGMHDPVKAAGFLKEHGANTVIIKTGSHGCYVQNSHESFTVPALQVEAIDTTGAGDNFTAGFLAGLYDNVPLKECVCMAIAAGSLSTAGIGAAGASYCWSDVKSRIPLLLEQITYLKT